VNSRIASGILANSLIRSAYAAGGSAATSGAILLITAEKGAVRGLLERIYDREGRASWTPKSTELVENKEILDEYIARERRRDPDMWVIELDVPNVERFTAELATGD
jgi:hypothetical protein